MKDTTYKLYKINKTTLDNITDALDNSNLINCFDISRIINISKNYPTTYFDPKEYNYNTYGIKPEYFPPKIHCVYFINEYQKNILDNISYPFVDELNINTIISLPNSLPIIMYTYPANSYNIDLLKLPNNPNTKQTMLFIYGIDCWPTLSHYFDYNFCRTRYNDAQISMALSTINIDKVDTRMDYCFNGQSYINELIYYNKMTNISHCYDSCRRIKESPKCSDNVIDMSYAYSNSSVTGKAICGENVINMAGAYVNTAITSFEIKPKVTDISCAFSYCSSLNMTNFYEKIPSSVINGSYAFCGVPAKQVKGVPEDFPIKDCSGMFAYSYLNHTLDSGLYSFGKYATNVAFIWSYCTGRTFEFPPIETPKTTDYCSNWFSAFYSSFNGTKHWGNIYVTNKDAYLARIVNNRYQGTIDQWTGKGLDIYTCPEVFNKLSLYGYEYLNKGTTTGGGWDTSSSSILYNLRGNLTVHLL